ncbi:MAG: hypothetical protein L6R42_009957 [Xanthoria sp. 1 TBL-2021]|nr:MAG: hypothetical protein L6R42_009957 [Xanthoria sp. 1 TBL-2021]
MLPQSKTAPVSLSIKKKESRSSLLGTFFPGRVQPPSKRNSAAPPIKIRGVVGADPGELSIRASMARKKAFQLESFENGEYGDYEDTDGEEMEQEMEEMQFLLQYESQDLAEVKVKEEPAMLQPMEGRERGRRQKSFAARLLSRGSQ